MFYIRWISAVLLLAFAGYMFPLFHIHKLDEIERKRKMEQFNPEEFSKDFWKNQLQHSMDQAVSMQTLMPLINNDPHQAKDKYSNTIGIGSVYYYYLKGAGYVKSIEEDAVAVVLQKESQNPDLRIMTGKIFGNAIRNGCNQLNVSDFPNSQEFNQISIYLNKIVENEVLPPFKNNASLGDRVNFVGCCEIIDEDADLHPLKLIPITLKIEKGL
ncbi:MAG: DUF2291 family protein [Candidatus Omnitrophota bacterium]|jgi:predicted lipoprotein|nr:MAG: DUF2291 family protein [Candidatus Omnitrophota bacterium]